MPTLSVKDVYYDYVQKFGVTHALQGVTTEFISGKLYALTGRSGSGKTTLLSLIASFDKPSRGDILLDGKSIFDNSGSEYRLENIGMIFQSYNLIGHLTAEENVMLAMGKDDGKGKARREKARELLSRMGLETECFKKRPLTLSGGQQQRVAIARALASNAPIILADEPTGNLDNENSRNIISLLKSLAHDDDRCVIVVTHSEDIAREADVRLTMSDGRFEN